MEGLRLKKNDSDWPGCGETRTLVHCWRDCKMVQLLWVSLAVSASKNENIELPSDAAILLLGYIFKIIENRDLKS